MRGAGFRVKRTPEHSTQHPEFINLMFPVAITVKQNLTIIKNPQKEFSTLLAIFKCEMQQMHATKILIKNIYP